MGNQSSLEKQVSAEEWQVRIDLAACYRAVALYGWDDLVFTHISARVPGQDDRSDRDAVGHPAPVWIPGLGCQVALNAS